MYTKNELRPQLKALRAALPDKAEKDAAILERLLQETAFAQTVFVYVSMAGEPDTHTFIRRTDKRVLVPHTADGVMTARLYAGAPLMPDKLGNVGGQPYAGRIDCVIVPLLGFNAQLYRIGYGGGYYDRFLAQHDASTVGLAYEECACEFAPELHDIPLDRIITPNRTIVRSEY